MSIPLLIAGLLSGLAFFVHTFVGDYEIRQIEPEEERKKKRLIWTMARCGWHWISLDLLLATVGIFLLNFTDYFSDKVLLLNLLSIYFLGYALAWLITIIISKSFPRNYLQLGQWILLLVISGLIYWA
jgi:hypothetical protein